MLFFPLHDVGIETLDVDTIVIPQDLLQVLYGVEHVDTDSPVQPCRF